MIGDDEINFPLKLLLTSRQVSNLHQAFANQPILRYEKLSYLN